MLHCLRITLPLSLCAVQVNSPNDILNAKKLLFPGVGSYGQAMNELRKQGYVEALKDYIQARPKDSATSHAPAARV
jgi:imidazoleglycerol phosphate synthase glutamine amidotransferase subunit HisH